MESEESCLDLVGVEIDLCVEEGLRKPANAFSIMIAERVSEVFGLVASEHARSLLKGIRPRMEIIIGDLSRSMKFFFQ